MPSRNVLRLIYKIGMIGATVVLSVLAYISYRDSTPGTGDVLLSWVLGVLAFLTLLSVPKLDRHDAQAETYRGILDDVRSRFPVNVKFTGANMPPLDAPSASTASGWSDTGAPVSIHFADPEVHRVDADIVKKAKQMSAVGAPIDDICRMIDPDHDLHDPMHREAFRRIVQAMITEG